MEAYVVQLDVTAGDDAGDATLQGRKWGKVASEGEVRAHPTRNSVHTAESAEHTSP